MSVNTNESIYNLIPEPVPTRIKASRYRSRFSDTVKEETKQSKANSKTMVSEPLITLHTLFIKCLAGSSKS